MLKFQPVAYRPAVAPPRIWRQAPRKYALSQTFDGLFAWSGTTGDIIRLLFHGTTATLGYHVWITDKGFWKYFGLFLGLGQTVGFICDVISLGQRATGTHPVEK